MTLAAIGTLLLKGSVSPSFRSKTIIATAALSLIAAVKSEAKDWRGIVPLHSTRAEVERILGPPTMNRVDWVVYHKENEEVSIEFSRGPCTVEFSPWNVPSNVVISIWVTPKAQDVRFVDLKLDQTKFKKLQDYHVGTIVHYIREEEGVEYQVDEKKGTVILIKYFPTAADEPLRCPHPPNLLRETIKVDEYSLIPFAAEKKRLDKFAEQLRRYSSTNYASSVGYILAYEGRSVRNGEAIRLAKRAKNYLVQVHHIDPDRIVPLNAGGREKSTVELYLAPAGSPPPFSRPD